jgi:flagellar biosynthesis anti-sigma factor FlgM
VKIQGNKPPEGQEIKRPDVERTASNAPKERAQAAEKPAVADRINISRASKEAAEIMAAVAKLPDVREEKVRTLQEAIRSGAYTPDARRIAAKMLEEL